MEIRHEEILERLAGYRCVRELRRSDFYAEHGVRIERPLESPRVLRFGGAEPRLSRFLRVAQWNIEKGRRLPAIIDRLRADPVLRHADLLLLNEVDHGMNRSGNLDVAGSIGEALGMHAVFGAAHIELTKGTDDERDLPGENRDSLQGNALLTRHPVLESRIVQLPSCFEAFEFHEKRYGGRNCVWARLGVGGVALWAGSVHLEVRNTPACRARQMEYLMKHLPCGAGEPCVLGGDMNSNGFARGTFWRTAQSAARIVFRAPEKLREGLLHPETKSEPLFQAARLAGFDWEGANSFDETASAPIGELEDSDFLPSFAADRIKRRLEPFEGHLPFKLDWILLRGARPAGRGAVVDPAGETSRDPGAVSLPHRGVGRISDHRPIYADIVF